MKAVFPSRGAGSHGPKRIVSLVPSLTEALAVMLTQEGCTERLVGRTRFCVEPVSIASVTDVGGTKNPDLKSIVDLAPDLVVVSREENRLEDYEALRDAGLPILVTHPQTVSEAVETLEALAVYIGCESAAEPFIEPAREFLGAASPVVNPTPVFCPIWRNPWMTFSDRTYVGDVLKVSGFENVCSSIEAPDFFEINLDDVRGRQPILALLPNEPYTFGEVHGEELVDAGIVQAYQLIDGKDLSWYGPRIATALRRLASLQRQAGR